MTDASSSFGEAYRINSVKPSETLPGMQGVGWHCYIIVLGRNSMRGYRQESHPVVMDAVEQIVNQLNERWFGKRRRASREEQSAKTTRSTVEELDDHHLES